MKCSQGQPYRCPCFEKVKFSILFPSLTLPPPTYLPSCPGLAAPFRPFCRCCLFGCLWFARAVYAQSTYSVRIFSSLFFGVPYHPNCQNSVVSRESVCVPPFPLLFVSPCLHVAPPHGRAINNVSRRAEDGESTSAPHYAPLRLLRLPVRNCAKLRHSSWDVPNQSERRPPTQVDSAAAVVLRGSR